jgi:Fur family ferric uptake transcriptional regulator
MKERHTRQKQIVAQLLQDIDRPLTVPEILALGQKRMPGLGVATVYRSIRRLLETAEIQSVIIPGDPVRYEAAKHHHHHFKCNGCEKVYELEGCVGDLQTIVPRGFRMEAHDLTVYGQCRACA